MASDRKRVSWLVQFVLLLCAWCLMSPLVALPVYQRLLFFPVACIPENIHVGLSPLSAHCNSIKIVKFSNSSGRKLSGCLLVRNPTAPCVLLSHGNAGNLCHRTILAEAILRAGFSVFLYDYQGYGCSEGSPSISGVIGDAVSAYDYLTTVEHIPPNQILAYGESLGCGVTAELSKLRSVRAMILQSGFPSLIWAAHDRLWFTWLYPQSWFPDLDCISAVRERGHAPLLLIHGTDDTAFPSSYSKLLYDKACERKKLVIIKGLKHNLDSTNLLPLQKVLEELRQSL